MRHNIECYEFNFDDNAPITKITILSGNHPIRPCLAIFDDLGKRIIPFEFCTQYLDRFRHQKSFNHVCATFKEVRAHYASTTKPNATLQSALTELPQPLQDSAFPQLSSDQTYVHLAVDFDNPWFDEAKRRALVEKIVLTPDQASCSEHKAFRALLNDTALPLMLEGYQVSGYREKQRRIMGSSYDGKLSSELPRYQFHQKHINADTAKIITGGNKVSIGFCCATPNDKLSNRLVAHIFNLETSKIPSLIDFEDSVKNDSKSFSSDRTTYHFKKQNIEQQVRLPELERTDIKNIKRITPFVVDEVTYTHRVGGILYADSIAGARQGYVALKSLPDDFHQLLLSDVKSNGLLLLAENTKHTHFEHAGGAWIQDFTRDGIRDQLRSGVIRIDGRSGTSAHDGILVKLATKNASADIISVFSHEAAHHYWFSVNNQLAQARGLTYGVANNLAHLSDPFYFRNRTINGLHLSRANFNHDYFMALTKHMSGLSIQSAFDIPRLGSIERPGAAYLIFRRPLEYFRDDLQASMEHLLKLKPGAYPHNIEALIRNTELRLYSNEKGAISTFIENLHDLHPQLPYTRIRAAITEANRTMSCELGAHFKQSLVLYPKDTVSLAAPIVQQYKQIAASNVEMMPPQVGNYQPQIFRTGFQYLTQYSKQGMAARSVMPRFYNVVKEYVAEQARLPVPTIIGKFSTPSYPVIGQPIKIWDVTASAKCSLASAEFPRFNQCLPKIEVQDPRAWGWRSAFSEGRRVHMLQRLNYPAWHSLALKGMSPVLQVVLGVMDYQHYRENMPTSTDSEALGYAVMRRIMGVVLDHVALTPEPSFDPILSKQCLDALTKIPVNINNISAAQMMSAEGARLALSIRNQANAINKDVLGGRRSLLEMIGDSIITDPYLCSSYAKSITASPPKHPNPTAPWKVSATEMQDYLSSLAAHRQHIDNKVEHFSQLPANASIPWQNYTRDFSFHDDLRESGLCSTQSVSNAPSSFYSSLSFEFNQPSHHALDVGFASQIFPSEELAWSNQFGDSVGDSSFFMDLTDPQSQKLHKAMEKFDRIEDGFRGINIPQINASFEIGSVTTSISIGGDEPGIEFSIDLSKSKKEQITFLGETYYYKIEKTGKGVWDRYIRAKDYRVTVWRKGCDPIKDWIEVPKRQFNHAENTELFNKTVNNLLSECASKRMEGYLNQFNQYCDAKIFGECAGLTGKLRQKYTDEPTIIGMLNTWDKVLKTAQANDIYEKIKVLAEQEHYKEALYLCPDLKTYLSDQAVFEQIENDLKLRLTLQQHSPQLLECLADKRFDDASQLIENIRAKNSAVGAIEELAVHWQKQLELALADDLIQSGEFEDAYSALLPFCENIADLSSYIDECRVSKVAFEIKQAIFGDSFDVGRKLTNNDRRPLSDILVDLEKIETLTERTRGMVNAKKAEIYHELCDFQQAELCYAAAREAKPLDMSLALNHAQCLAGLYQFDEACKVAEPFSHKVGLRLGLDITEFTEGQVLFVPGNPILRLQSIIMRPGFGGEGQDKLVFMGADGEIKTILLTNDFLKNLPQDFWSLEEPGKFYDPNISYYSKKIAEYVNQFIIAAGGVPMRSGDNGAAIVAIREQQYQLQAQHLEVLFSHFFSITQKAAGLSGSKKIQLFERTLSTTNQLFPSALPLSAIPSWSGWKNMGAEEKTAWKNKFRLAFRPWLNFDKDKTQAILGTVSLSFRAANIIYANMLRQRLSVTRRPRADMAIQCTSLGLQLCMTIKSGCNIAMKNAASDGPSFMISAPRIVFAVSDYYYESQGRASENANYYGAQKVVNGLAVGIWAMSLLNPATTWLNIGALYAAGGVSLWGMIDKYGDLEDAYSGVLKNIDYLRRESVHIGINTNLMNKPNRYEFIYVEDYKCWTVNYYDKSNTRQDSYRTSLMKKFPDPSWTLFSNKKPNALTEQDRKQIESLVTIHHQNEIRTECLRKINAVITKDLSTPSNGSNGQSFALRESLSQKIIPFGIEIIDAVAPQNSSYTFYQTNSSDTNIVGQLKRTLWMLQAEKALSRKDDVAYLAITKIFKSDNIFKFTHMDCAIELYSNFILCRLEPLAKLGEGHKFFEEVMEHCAYLCTKLKGDDHEKFTSQFTRSYKQCVHLLMQKIQEWVNGEDVGLKEKAKTVAIRIYNVLWLKDYPVYMFENYNWFGEFGQKSVLSVPMQTLLAEILMRLKQDDEGLAIFKDVPSEKQDDNYWTSFAKAYLLQSKINESFKCISKITLLNENLEALSVLTGLLNRLIKNERRGNGKYYLLHYVLGYYVTAFSKHEDFNEIKNSHKNHIHELKNNACIIKDEGQRMYTKFREVSAVLYQQLENGELVQAMNQIRLANMGLTTNTTKLPTHHTVEEQPRTMFFKYNSGATPSKSSLRSEKRTQGIGCGTL